jgi:hypothetical protein
MRLTVKCLPGGALYAGRCAPDNESVPRGGAALRITHGAFGVTTKHESC